MHALLTYVLAGLSVTAVTAGPVQSRQLTLKPKTPISAEIYNNIAKYPAYTTAPYLLPFINPCIPPYGAVMTDYFNITSTDTQMAVFRNDNDKEIIVGIPGTNSTQDYLTDLSLVLVPYNAPNISCPLCLVHFGFLTAWNSIASDIYKAVNTQLAAYPTYSVIVAGHSLGGALCSLVYASMTEGKFPVKAAYCSGSPRVGNLVYANLIDSLSGSNDTTIGNYFRITHYDDGVPQLIPRALGYEHPRTEFWESAYNSTLNTTYHCYGQEPYDCNDLAGLGHGINSAHASYAGLTYDCKGGFTPNPPDTDPELIPINRL